MYFTFDEGFPKAMDYELSEKMPLKKYVRKLEILLRKIPNLTLKSQLNSLLTRL